MTTQAIPATIQSSGTSEDNATLMHVPCGLGIGKTYAPYSGPTITKGNQSIVFWVDIPTNVVPGTYNSTWNLTVISLP